jgi:hypothetical protein
MRKRIVKQELLGPGEVEQKLDDLLVFDCRGIDPATRGDLRRILPRILRVSHAWSAHFEKYGCIGCRTGRPDSIPAIAARLRRRGLSWSAILADIGRTHMTGPERKAFRAAVGRHLSHPDMPEQEPASSAHVYGGGGLCALCRVRLRRELLAIMGEMDAEPNVEQETAALTRRFDVARRLLSGGDE